MTESEWLFDAIVDLTTRADNAGFRKVANRLELALDDYLEVQVARPSLRAADLIFGRSQGRCKADVGRRTHLNSLTERRGAQWVERRQLVAQSRPMQVAG